MPSVLGNRYGRSFPLDFASRSQSMFRSSWFDLSGKNMLKLLNLEHFFFR